MASDLAFEATASSPSRPALLPAFEPLSSSPAALPRASKRKFDQTQDQTLSFYPTPVPTSTTGILPSSPPPKQTRPGLQRTVSTLSERAPLGDVPSLDLPYNGEPMLMGRSSNSSDYQLSANRHISRVHVRAQYLQPTPTHSKGRVEVECIGWNGAKVHCRGEIRELAKGDCFVSDKPSASIMVDVQDTRVMLIWPKEAREHFPQLAEAAAAGSSWLSKSPHKKRILSHDQIGSSPPPLLVAQQQRTPRSPAPANLISTFSSTFPLNQSPVKVYEDHSSDEDAPHENATPVPAARTKNLPEQSAKLLGESSDELSEHDEENDPIIHSFGPFGDNILSKFASFQPTSPQSTRQPLTASPSSRNVNLTLFKPSPIKNHVINQLAYSRIHSVPLSTIHSNLPAELRGAMAKPSDIENRDVLTTSGLKTMLDDIPCVGEISREGKDAAGKLLESEFYYIPEHDADEMRRNTVTQSLGKTSIRAARKQHKVCIVISSCADLLTDLSLLQQYFWKPVRH